LIDEASRALLLEQYPFGDFFCEELMFRSLLGVLLTGTWRTRYLLTMAWLQFAFEASWLIVSVELPTRPVS
jgi:hypothetical protein